MKSELNHKDSLLKLFNGLSISFEELKDNFKRIGQFFIDVGRDISKHINNRNQFYLILAELGWPPPHDTFISSNMREIDRIVENFEKMSIESVRNDVNELMLRWHSKEVVEDIFFNWKSKIWLKKRMPILQDAIWAHQNGYFTLSVTALIPQVEGILADNLRIKGYMSTTKFKDYINSLLHPAFLITNRNKNIEDFISNTLLASFMHGSELNSSFSRHAIAHGFDVSYGTDINSLKAILLINAVNKLFRLEALKDSKTIHLNGCHLIRKSEKERVFFSNLLETTRKEYKDYKLCSVCMNKKAQDILV